MEKKFDFGLKICSGHKNPITERCKTCTEDYNLKNGINNYNCPDKQLKEIVDGICIEHVRYAMGLKTAKENCSLCTSDFENCACDCYSSFPPIKYEEFVNEIERQNLSSLLKREEKIKKYIMLMNIGILKSGNKERVSYDKVINDMQFFLNEKRKVDSSSKKI